MLSKKKTGISAGPSNILQELVQYIPYASSDNSYTGETSMRISFARNHIVDAAELNFLAVG